MLFVPVFRGELLEVKKIGRVFLIAFRFKVNF